MSAAGSAALTLADAIEAYLRKGGGDVDWNRAFQPACDAANQYLGAIRAAEPYHFGTIPRISSSHIINLSNDELLCVMRELRGQLRSLVVGAPNGVRTAILVPSEDGAAGFFALEVQSMRRFVTNSLTMRRDPVSRRLLIVVALVR